jgi:hypothetical protein
MITEYGEKMLLLQPNLNIRIDPLMNQNKATI